MAKRGKPKYRTCPECEAGMSILDSRVYEQHKIYRRYECNGCKKRFSSMEHFITGVGANLELLRMQSLHNAVFDLLEAVSKQRASLNEIEIRLLEEFNKGRTMQAEEPDEAVGEEQRFNANNVSSPPELGRGVRISAPTERASGTSDGLPLDARKRP